MGFSFTPFVLIMLFAAAACMIIGLYALLRRPYSSESLPLVILMLASTEWLATSALGFAGLEPDAKMAWAKAEYLGVVSVPLLVLVLAVNHSDYRRWLTRNRLVLLAVIPVVTLLLAWTNELHGLVWATYAPYVENGMMLSRKVYGIFFWIYWVYSYLVLLMATVTIVRSAIATSKVFMWQAIVLIVGILAPWAGNLIYVLHLGPMGNLDLTPLAFGFTSVMIALGMIRWGLFDLRPLAQGTVLAEMSDGLVVLDGRMRVVEMNPSAETVLHTRAADAVGRPANRVLPATLYSIASTDPQEPHRGVEITLKQGGEELCFEITRTPILNKRRMLTGSVITLHDQTEFKRMEGKLLEAERRESRQALDESQAKYKTILEEMGDAYFEVDLEGNFTFVNKAMCDALGYSQSELTGMNYRAMTAPESIKEVFAAYNQVYREQRDKAVVSYRIQRKDGQQGFVEVMTTLQRDRDGKVLGFRCVGRDITGRKKSEDEIEKANVVLKKTLKDTIGTLIRIVEMRDPYTAGHQQRVADLATSMATEMGLSTEQVEQIRVAAVMHDIGKIYVPSEILSKPGQLTRIEFDMIKMHSRGSFDIVQGIDFPASVAQSILQHHERIDGSGYPEGLKGDAILLEARILAVADVVEAMASHRPYRPALGIDQALAEISSNRGTRYDPAVVDACLRLFNEHRFSFG